ncbi:MAG: YebC/PmpR family DNA-binding transcriptional regulator, partial [Limnochordales bacterium]
VAIMLEIMTDNRNRTASEVRHLFSRYGGNLGESGCVAWMFERRGLVTLDRSAVADEDELLLVAAEAGADDVTTHEDHIEVQTDPALLEQVKEHLSQAGYTVASAQVAMVPKTSVAVAGDDAERLMKLLSALEDHDDVQEVYANFDVPDEVLQTLEV